MKFRTKLIVLFGLLTLAGVAYYGLSPLWRTSSLEEAVPLSAKTLVAPRSVVATSGHPASGTVSILRAGNVDTLRFENFKTINGPDLRVYLSTDLKATDFVDLGELKATEGNVNYAIPSGTDLRKYHYVLVWCQDFSVLFNSTDIQQ